MRVATRRLRAAFEVFGAAFDPKALKPHLKGLRATGRALGQVRDLDVFMEKAARYQESMAPDDRLGLEPLLQTWHSQREKARLEMLTYLDSPVFASFKNDFTIFVSSTGLGVPPEPKGNPIPRRVCELAPMLIYERLAFVRAYDSDIQQAPPIETLHALRIEYKKLRYTVEYFRDVLGPQSKDLINEFKNLQDHLGDLHDAQVAIQILQDFMKAEKKKPAQALQTLDTELHAISAYQEFRQQELIHLKDSFPEVWAHFNRPEFMQQVALVVSVL
jgi:CHAD domain-containing protein